MRVYNYHYETKEFLTSKEAEKSPMEKDVYLFPANSTAIKVLENKKGFAVCFNEEKNRWDYVTDNRGKTCFSTQTKEKQEIDYLGELKEGFTFLKPNEHDKWGGLNWIIDIEMLKQLKINYINLSCKEAIESGFSSAALSSSHTYPSDKEDQLNLIGVLASGVEQLFKCKADNEKTWQWKKHTTIQLKKVLTDGAIIKGKYLQKSTLLKAKALSALTIDEIDKIKW